MNNNKIIIDLPKLMEYLDNTFAYEIEKFGNSDGFAVKIYDGFGIRRAYSHEGTLKEAVYDAIKQYQTKEHN